MQNDDMGFWSGSIWSDNHGGGRFKQVLASIGGGNSSSMHNFRSASCHNIILIGLVTDLCLPPWSVDCMVMKGLLVACHAPPFLCFCFHIACYQVVAAVRAAAAEAAAGLPQLSFIF